MRLVVVTAGGEGIARRVHEAVDAGAEVLVRELSLPAGLPLDRVILHARIPGALGLATALHLSADMDVGQWRRQFSGLLSASAHSAEEAAAKRAAGADTIFLAPIFASRHGRPPLGVEGLAGHVALGGCEPRHVAACRAAGAAGIAVLGGVWYAPGGIAAAVQRYRFCG